jgi:hypothetical protein
MVAWWLFDVLVDSRGDATGLETAGDGLGSEAWYSVVQPNEDDGVALVEEDGVALDENDGVAFVAVELCTVEEGLGTANEPPRRSVQLDEDGDSLDTLYLWYATLGDGMGLTDGDGSNKGCWSRGQVHNETL